MDLFRKDGKMSNILQHLSYNWILMVWKRKPNPYQLHSLNFAFGSDSAGRLN